MTEGQDVAVDPNSPKTVYLALPDGIAVSTDGAMTLARRENGLPERGKYTQALASRSHNRRPRSGGDRKRHLPDREITAVDWRRVLPTETTVNDIQQSPHDPSPLAGGDRYRRRLGVRRRRPELASDRGNPFPPKRPSTT